MPVTCQERGVSRNRDDRSIEVLYLVRGTDDDEAAIAALETTSPATRGGFRRDNCSVEQTGPTIWDGAVEYKHQVTDIPQTGESRFSFEIAGGQQHVTQSLETMGRYALPGQTAPDFKGAIGVTHQAVEGVDIIVPVYRFAETHYRPAADVDAAYRSILFAATGKMNLDQFRDFKPGEVLFLGAGGSLRGGGEDWEIAYSFAASPQRENFQIGQITVPLKAGWDYLWVRYADEEDADAKAVVKRPTAVYIERVYEPYMFSSLEI